jgi:predicted ATPase
MQRVWPGTTVGETTLHVHISAVRKALGQDRHLVKTAQGRGYRLLGAWAARDSKEPPALQHRRISAALPPTNFSPLVMRLIGRSEAVQRVRDLISAYRVVTLTGPGGIGKTVLATKAVHGLMADFDSAWFVELASLSDPDLVPTAVATVLGLKLSGEKISAEAVARTVGDTNLLLVFDNCEHVIDAAANFVETFVRMCPRATILATSREILRTHGEYVYRVPSLQVPPPDEEEPDQILNHSAVELFIAKTKASDSDFSVQAAMLPVIGAICRRLDGIPLAIEFAAAGAMTSGVQQVAAGLRDRFALLTRGRRTALPRHKTLRATLDWSYELLPEVERQLLRRLAVFLGGFTVDAAIAVTNDTGLDAPAVIGGIANLVAKSLVVLDNSDTGTRWSLLETIRVYALDKLAEHDDANATARRHAAYYCDLLAPQVGAKAQRTNNDLALAVREIDNGRAALNWAFSPSGDGTLGIYLTAALAPVWLHMQECRERCELALRVLETTSAPDLRVRMELQIHLGISLLDTMGPAQQARDLLTSALSAAEALDDLDAQAGILSNLVANYIFQAEHRKGLTAAERLYEVATRIGNPAIVRVADRSMGIALLMLGRPREGQRFLERFLEGPRLTPDQMRLFGYRQDHPAAVRAFLARALWLQGFIESAYREAQASLDELQSDDHGMLLCRVLYFGMCRIAPSTGDFAAADRNNARLIAAATTLNAPFWQTAGRFLAGKLLIERGEFAQGVVMLREAFETCRRTGWRMSYPEFKGALASGLIARGELTEALDVVKEGLAAASQGDNGQDLFVAELLRVKGEALLQQKAVAEAEEAFYEALTVARQQGALLWELRAALSLARLLMNQGRRDEARQLVMPVYDQFTEGFESINLKQAKEMLDALHS